MVSGTAEQAECPLPFRSFRSFRFSADVSETEWSAEQRNKRNDFLPFRFSADFLE